MKKFVKVAKKADVTPGKMKLVDAGNEQIVLANVGIAIVAFNNVCPHAECDLAFGALEGEELECDCHGSRFNISTGEVLSGPSLEPLTRYAIRLERDDILVGPA
ncbi:MAG: Rieske (2Fe-2S) protein [Dehalococcoidia bacterium]|nr:Rieske (2Fe-2S) protein [Dehalococcoidia bacterium]